MRRSLAFSSKSIVEKFLFRQKFPVESSRRVVDGRISHFQRALIYSPTSYWYSYLGKHAHFAPYELLLSKRFVHATGAPRSAERDYYEILGISKDATRDEIKEAFHALAKKYHPDANKNNPSAKRKFQEIRDAYETLQDPEKRSHYDMMRGNPKRDQNAEYSNMGWDHFREARKTKFSNSFHEIFSEIFDETEDLGGDVQVELVLTFSEAAKGCTKNLSFDADVPCDSCHGRGHPLDAETKLCPTCRGVGRVTIPPFTTTCRTCKGFGRIIKEYCMECEGSGVYKGVRNVKLTIPAVLRSGPENNLYLSSGLVEPLHSKGVDSGDTVRVPNAGNSGGWGRASGVLLINLKVAKDRIFSRQGTDVYVNSYISFTQAILGGSVEVPTLSGKMQLQIPKGVQHGQLALLRGKGLPKSGFLVDHGDQYVRFCVNLPSTLNERQRAILEEFEREIVDENNTSAEGNWWQYWVERVSGPKFILEFSILTLILLFFVKVLN